jgi:hypothetical protein
MGTHHQHVETPEGRAAAEELMCEAIYRLASWGYSLRPGGSHAGAFEAVAAAAAKRLKRTDAKGLALSYKRVEQIYQAWLRTEVERGRLEGAMVRGTWQRYAVQSLRNAAPAQVHAVGDVFKLADLLLVHKADWPPPAGSEDWLPQGDFELTAGADREWRATPRLRLKR